MRRSKRERLREEQFEALARQIAGDFFDYYLRWNAETRYRHLDVGMVRTWFVQGFGPRVRHCAEPDAIPDFEMACERAAFLGGMQFLHEQVLRNTDGTTS